MSEQLPTYRLFNGTGHPIDCADGRRLERDRDFPKAIRARTKIKPLGNISVQAQSVVGEAPLYEMSLTRSIEDPKAFKARVTSIQEQLEIGEHAALVVSPIAAVAIKLLRYNLPDNITVAYPAGMIRDQDNDGRITHAKRLDTLPRRKNKLGAAATKRLIEYRQQVLNAQSPWQLVNHLPQQAQLQLSSGARITLGAKKSHIIEPDYNHSHKIGTAEAPYNIPIVEPTLKQILHVDQINPNKLALVHSRAIPPLVQLPPPNVAEKLAHTVILHSRENSRTQQGFQEGFNSLLVYSPETMHLLAEQLPA